jgi:hypothetical protein
MKAQEKQLNVRLSKENKALMENRKALEAKQQEKFGAQIAEKQRIIKEKEAELKKVQLALADIEDKIK